jgi:hypothetical protein
MTSLAIALAGALAADRRAGSGSWLAYVVSVLVLLGAMCGTYYLCVVLDRRARDRGDSTEGDGEGGGGAKRGGGRVPPKPPSGTDPEWWPEFERQFADHVRCRIDPGAQRDRSRAAGSSCGS